MPRFAIMLAKSDPPTYVCCATPNGRVADLVLNPENACIAYLGADAAKALADNINGRFKLDGDTRRVKVQKILLPDEMKWQDRERQRLESGAYKAVPWADEPWYAKSAHAKVHFAHISTESEAKVAYTPDAEYGAADRQLSIRPGRYLEKYFGKVLDSSLIAEMSAKFCKDVEGEFLLARTPDEIEHVYLNGPSSCMSPPFQAGAGHYHASAHCHPVRAYAGPDLAIAYLKRGKKITARALCWPDKKIYSRIYGDAARLQLIFQREGYREAYGDRAAWFGARVVPIRVTQKKWRVAGHCYVMPYWDAGAWFTKHPDGQHLVFTDPNKLRNGVPHIGSGGTSLYTEDQQ